MKYVYALKTVKSDRTSHGGFRWKKRGVVVAPDWNPDPVCGGGLHAFLRGEGNGSLADWSTDALWLVLKIPEGTYVDLGGKIKFPRCTVVFCGDRKSATDKLQELGCSGPIIGAYKVGGYRSTVSGGDRSTVSGGDRSTVSGGDRSTVSGGDRSTVSGGHESRVSGGDRSTVSGGHGSTVSGGHESRVSGGYRSTVSGGDWSVLTLSYYDGTRHRLVTRYVGEDGIRANTKYRLNNAHKFEEVK